MQMGSFFRYNSDDSFIGKIFALGFPTPVHLKLLPSQTKQGQKFYKISQKDDISNHEIGSAWPKVSMEGKAYLSVTFDSPLLPAPFYGRLVKEKDGDDYLLFWDRTDKSKPRMQAKPVNTADALTV